jgi:hypothetical protein
MLKRFEEREWERAKIRRGNGGNKVFGFLFGTFCKNQTSKGHAEKPFGGWLVRSADFFPPLQIVFSWDSSWIAWGVS